MPDESAIDLPNVNGLGSGPLTIEEVLAISCGRAQIRLNRDSEYVKHIRGGTTFGTGFAPPCGEHPKPPMGYL